MHDEAYVYRWASGRTIARSPDSSSVPGL